ncbi:hypothetical protein MSG28_003980 [Choristoneura fumiferana]|uniref:Uncharacterized protein n=1 Tax=Choristoneura fumiferana TaxID=7141 RepID=A0ACC0KGX1_CHOFU|nr:hypothetical protein MSG28_003980 [Choristoneura fumiferana]
MDHKKFLQFPRMGSVPKGCQRNPITETPPSPIYVLLLGTGLLSEQEGLGHSSHAGPVRFAVRLKLISADSLRCAPYVQLDDSTKCGEIQAISHCSHKGITGWCRDLGTDSISYGNLSNLSLAKRHECQNDFTMMKDKIIKL